jgi:hypothetical protein
VERSSDVASRLRPLPETFPATVEALHRVAELIVAPARKPDKEIALEATPAGFGTPWFEYDGARHQVRVEGSELVHSVEDSDRRVPLDSLRGAGRAVAELLPDAGALDGAELGVDREAALALADCYAFGSELLSALVAAAGARDEPSPVRLWPEHFDIAIELGSEGDGARANYGLSPGDDEHPEPYLYVGPWSAEVSGERWQATGFRGAELAYSALLSEPDRRRAAMDFFESRRKELSK